VNLVPPLGKVFSIQYLVAGPGAVGVFWKLKTENFPAAARARRSINLYRNLLTEFFRSQFDLLNGFKV
jgi:hypothetical protein